MTTGHHPDGWTFEVTTALQHDVDEELRRAGYPVQPWPEPFGGPAPVPLLVARASPLTGHRRGRATVPAHNVVPGRTVVRAVPAPATVRPTAGGRGKGFSMNRA